MKDFVIFYSIKTKKRYFGDQFIQTLQTLWTTDKIEYRNHLTKTVMYLLLYEVDMGIRILSFGRIFLYFCNFFILNSKL